MKEKQYYTPDLEDLHLGYELEYRVKSYSGEITKWHQWKEVTVDDGFLARGYSESPYYSDVEIRTSYLSKEDIESLEWEFVEKIDYSNSIVGYDVRQIFRKNLKDDILLNFYYELVLLSDYRIAIYLCSPENKNGVRSFFGECKSINELKKILKWLKIK